MSVGMYLYLHTYIIVIKVNTFFGMYMCMYCMYVCMYVCRESMYNACM